MTKVTIIGAGSVGSTIAYTLAVGGICTEIVMIDMDSCHFDCLLMFSLWP